MTVIFQTNNKITNFNKQPIGNYIQKTQTHTNDDYDENHTDQTHLGGVIMIMMMALSSSSLLSSKKHRELK